MAIKYLGELVKLVDSIPSNALWWRNHMSIWRWCRQHTLISPAQHDAWLERIETDPTIKMFGIRAVQSDSKDIGVCGFTSINQRNQSAEFSLYIAPEHQKFGYGKSALRTLVRHGFEDWNLHRIWGETFDGNPAYKVFGELGFQLEGILRDTYYREGKFINSHIYATIKP